MHNHNIFRGRIVNNAIALLIVAICSVPAAAGVIESLWISQKGGAFHEPANWDGPVPNADVIAIFDLNSDYVVTFGAEALSDRILLGQGSVTFMLGGFNYSVLNPLALTPSIAIGDIAGNTAALTINGGTVSAQFTNIGEADGSTGSLELIGGAALINEFHLRVGHNGDGSLNVSDNSAAANLQTTIGIQDGVTGVATITGSGSELMADGALIVAQEGAGSMFVLDGASVASSNGIIGEQLTAMGEVTISGTGSTWMIDGLLDVGQSGHGVLNLVDGATASTASFATVGTFPKAGQDPTTGGVGEVIIIGQGSMLSVGGDLHIGFLAWGRWTLSSGGKVVVGGDLFRGDWLEGDEVPQTIIELASSDDYQTAAISVAGSADGFEPRVDLVNGFVPKAGDTFVIATAQAGLLPFTFDLPMLPPPRFWEVIQDANVVALQVGPVILGDLDGDGTVGVKDLLILLGDWGPCDDCTDCPADLDGDCIVGVKDLLVLLGNWS